MEATLHNSVGFTWIDYSLFSGMLVLSATIGIYFGCFGSKQKSKSEYLLGGKTMKVIPIAISLIASDVSGIALLAVPADIYRYGANYIWSCLGLLLVCLATSYIYIPVFHKLQLTSSYEYLKLRFDNKTRTFASLLFTLSMILYNPIVIYIPALALAQATGISVHLIASLVCATCIFYTAIGGLKAVVWTDTIQTVLMVASMTLVFCLGVTSVGGITNILNVSKKGHRLDILDFNLDPTIRDGICALTIGTLANGLSFISVSQSMVQRFLAVPTLADARKVISIFLIGIVVVKTTSAFTGLIMFTRYANCDPLSNGLVSRTDQILPYYIMDVAGHIPGLPGLFIAGILSASLSTLSGSLNTLAATVYEDFILRFVVQNPSERQTNTILKLIAVISGVICTAMVFVVENLGGILPIVSSFNAIAGGSLVGLFTLGMLFPVANAKGALCGAISGITFVTWVVIGNQWFKQQPYYVDPVKPFSTAGCAQPENVTVLHQIENVESPFYLFRVTFWYHTLMGITVTISVGLLISWFTKEGYPPVHPDLLSPVLSIFKNDKKIKPVEADTLNESRALNTLPVDQKNLRLT